MNRIKTSEPPSARSSSAAVACRMFSTFIELPMFDAASGDHAFFARGGGHLETGAYFRR
ncbi:MAG: hypothetical protein U0X87_15675 [Anaerolineales bacterium]